MAIISLTGKIGAGKDTVADMIKKHAPTFQVRKFAAKLKQIASILTGIPAEKFEDRIFKESNLPSQWDRWIFVNKDYQEVPTPGFPRGFAYEWDAREFLERFPQPGVVNAIRIPTTVRQFLQWLGTDAIRDHLHPSAWINALFCDYNTNQDWVISDCRFPNEAYESETRDGLVIAIDRPGANVSYHVSETAMDNYPVTMRLHNDGSIDQLEQQVIDHIDTFKSR